MLEPLLPLIVEANELEKFLGTENLLFIDLCPPDVYRQAHVPSAIHIDYSSIVKHEPPVMGLLPDEELLNAFFSTIGLSKESHVIAYDDEGGGMASRLLWTLEASGHTNFSLLNGGLHAWVNEGHKTESTPNTPMQRSYSISINEDVIANKTEILSRLDNANFGLLDARSPAEYEGIDVRAERGGHIPGAVNLDWTQTFDPRKNMRIKSDAELLEMLNNIDISADKDIVTYCHSHHRSALLYIILRHLGFPSVKGYPGSWSEWGNCSETPIE
jgi:thiosulfate/3-mercaptopyruvate sulfurtransferase